MTTADKGVGQRTSPTGVLGVLRSWWSAAPWQLWAVLGALLALQTYATLETTDPYVPDTRYYSAMTYHYLGYSPDEARDLTISMNDEREWATPPTENLFGWGLVQPRVVYPALSTPFVAAFGIDGMLVVPVMAFVLLVLGSFGFMSRRYGPVPASLVTALVLASPFLFKYSEAMLTESLAALFVAGIVATLPLSGPRGRRAVLVCAGLIVAVAFTRQAALAPATGLVAAWLGHGLFRHEWKNRWLPFATVGMGTAVGVQILQSILWPSFSILEQFERATGTDNVWSALRAAPGLALRILNTDFHRYMSGDRALLLLLVLAVLSAVLLYRRTETHLLVGSMAAVALLNLLNGTATSFRYAMPAVVFLMISVAALAAHAFASVKDGVRAEVRT